MTAIYELNAWEKVGMLAQAANIQAELIMYLLEHMRGDEEVIKQRIQVILTNTRRIWQLANGDPLDADLAKA